MDDGDGWGMDCWVDGSSVEDGWIDIENSGKGRYVQCMRDAELHLNQTGLTVIVAIAVCVPLLSSIFALSLNKIPRTGGTRYQTKAP
ncbi:unnamed protein product [Litomosoides sigmodontis]|uniref:Uncharacterized protein n=1 Tax=Litomosoides sigmodontis TaxID=42156 RepID=A0A3P7M9Y7_LITSI|nr:unnamed protein product [Litomosoides sigmodontis]